MRTELSWQDETLDGLIWRVLQRCDEAALLHVLLHERNAHLAQLGAQLPMATPVWLPELPPPTLLRRIWP